MVGLVGDSADDAESEVGADTVGVLDGRIGVRSGHVEDD